MTSIQKFLVGAAILLGLLVPSVSFAATNSNNSALIQSLIAQIALLQAQLEAIQQQIIGTGTTTSPTTLPTIITLQFTSGAPFTLTTGTTKSATDGKLTVALQNIQTAQTNTIGSSPYATAAQINLSYNSCTSSVACTAVYYPSKSATLSVGQSATYQNYTVTLSSLTATSATFTVSSSTGTVILPSPNSTSFSSGAPFTLATAGPTSATDGKLTIALQNIQLAQTTTIGSSPHAVGAVIGLSYSTACPSGAACMNSLVPSQSATLSVGQTTTYAGYSISLNALSTTTATFTAKSSSSVTPLPLDTSTSCTYLSNSGAAARTANASQSGTLSSCVTACTNIRNEVFGQSDSGTCTFKNGDALSTVSIPAVSVAAPTCSVTTSKSLVGLNESFTLTWSSTNADHMTGLPTQNTWPVSGSQAISLGSYGKHTYALTFVGTSGATTVCSTDVTVTDMNTPPPTCTMSVNPQTVAPNSGATLTWSTKNAASFTLTNYQGSVATSLSGSTFITPSQNIVYTGTAKNASGVTGSCSVTAKVSSSSTITAVPGPLMTTSSSQSASAYAAIAEALAVLAQEVNALGQH